MRKIIATIGAVATALSLGAGVASAETGKNPQLDQLCTHLAFVAPAPVFIINGTKVTGQLVGLRAKNDYCTSSDFVSPSDWD